MSDLPKMEVPLIGRTVSHYKVQDELSRGGMGIVYRATDLSLNRDVALKVLPTELVADPERRRRFLQEAQAAAALEHPHIAVIHEVGETEGTTFIAMELIRGEKLRDGADSLRQLAKRQEVLQAAEVEIEEEPVQPGREPVPRHGRCGRDGGNLGSPRSLRSLRVLRGERRAGREGRGAVLRRCGAHRNRVCAECGSA